ncbi:P-loop containing nucleoside triphosphate hydrolase protein [Aspergillus caelatus]|uniref:P-loop containing nucleoside triphosphate hydrolase protein n=1 Tax=Aspergillus caelatus TaxID=61420 RepID=A0A5N6ZX97_9EURO|nr:P-loop containing nucleoside triphosphate hydrolase protein [Aspergillus caelatus]KAE8362234.1 P-loop containing nucleoside triphosphate hydrolase protein [Aspergillus caelatus]
MADAPNKITITICGDGGCGKSSITLRLVRSQWIHEYDPTIEDSYSVTRTVDGVPYFLAITDTAGQEEYRGLWAASNLKSDAFLLVYDITNASSLSALDYFMEMIDIEAEQRVEDNQRLLKELGDSAQGLEVGMPPPVKIIAGNKCDLKEGRVIGAKEGLEYARKHGCGFMETSAREMVNIEETFALLVRRVVEARKQHYQKDIQATNIPQTAGSSPAKRSGATDQNKGAALKSSNEEGSRLRSLCCGISSGKERKIENKGSVLGHEASSKSVAPRLWRRLSCW